MFEDIKSLPELKGFDPDALYRRMKGYCGHAMLEDNIHDGAVDAYMECLESGDWTDVIHNAYRYSYRRYSREVYRTSKQTALITVDEWMKGFRGVVIDVDKACAYEGPARPRYDERGLTLPLKAEVEKKGEEALEKEKQYIRIAVERLNLSHPTHPDYDVVEVFYNYFVLRKKVKELYPNYPSFKSYGAFARTLRNDTARIQQWANTQEGNEEFVKLFGVGVDDLQI